MNNLNLHINQVRAAYKLGIRYMVKNEGFEPTSAFKQAASDIDDPIPEGPELKAFITIAHDWLDAGIKDGYFGVRQ